VIVFNLFFVIFNLLSLVLFIPFLKLIFKPEELAENITRGKPTYEGSGNLMEYCGDLYNYYIAKFIESQGGLVSALAFVCISVLIAFFLKNLSRYGAIYNQSYLRMAVVRDLRSKLFKKSMHLPLSFYSKEKKGDLMARMSSDLNEVEVAVVYALELIFREPIAIMINLAVLFYFSVELTLFSLILLPITAFMISRIGKSLKRTSKKGQEQMGELMSTIEESVGGIRIIKAFSAEKIAQERFEKRNRHHQRLITRTFRKRDLSSPLNEFVGAVVLVSLVWYGGSMVLENKGQMTGTNFLTFIIIFSQLLRPISGIASGLTAMKKAEASVERINGILNLDNPIKDAEKPVEKTSIESGITFDKVSFAYNEEPVLKNVSFKVGKGQVVALVGESGSGKSTLADLVPRFHDVGSGAIKIDDVDVRQMRKADLRKFIAIVTQESILFNDTIRNNIAFSKPDATDEEIIQAAKIANAHEFIVASENGYETNIGDRGNKLSGGQRQRLSIARAVLSNKPIMILDEATSSLDTESEKLVQDALDNLMKNRTTLVIAHRLSTIRNADKIIVLKKGEIVEEGSHQELIAKNGYYKSLCEIQQVL
jgi:subfamily B ATP-binding cassette protein MsbA